MRARPVDAPFALTAKESNTDRIQCLNTRAERAGLSRGMTLSDARALRPDLITRPADTPGDAGFLRVLARWAGRYCPWVGLEDADGLVLDVTGSTHLFGGETGLIADMRVRLMRAGLETRIGLGDSRGAAWALAHFGEGVAPPQQPLQALAELPVAALRLDPKLGIGLERLGLRSIADLTATPRAPLARRFGNGLLLRLDQALGTQPEPVVPLADPPQYGVRLTLPDPIGLLEDVTAGTARLLAQLCDKLKTRNQGARVLQLTLRRVDQGSQQVELRLARPMNDPVSILPLFERGLSGVEAGYGIDQLRLSATRVEDLAPTQIASAIRQSQTEDVAALITRIGTRIGLENVQRMLPADSHIPERSFILAAAAFSEAAPNWPPRRARPLRLFPPEPVAGAGPVPPVRFRWRRMALRVAAQSGPERLAPEWWLEDENWRRGLRDYWRVETAQGRRLWMFHTPQQPGWYVQGEFA
ncbi:DNA polymerase IV [Thalassovita gelatinovora]|uniref:DNA-directed DNA polymerase n=1 Tax=Thalassovita gelatinovora TaxID=53501 RepID=A0A0P1FH96_THAGE|nr:DNA polymerase IV [Thalassovita gelatinovora]SEP75426.1 protein ImuB [Thalassovita gelatinovora]